MRNTRGGKWASTGKILVDGAGGTAAFVDSPDDKGLATPTIASDKNALKVGGEFSVLTNKSLPITARVLDFEPEHFPNDQLGTNKAGGEQYKVRRLFLF